MDEIIPFARPFTSAEEEEAVIRVLRSGWLTTGGESLAFEKEFADFLEGGKSRPGEKINCLAVNSATSGLHLALEACGVKEGDLVLLPSYTFTATAEVIRYLGADPVFVDTAPGTFLMDPKALEHSLEKLPVPAKAKAVMPVHFGGLPCDMEAILSIAEKYGLKVVEDAAHSFPSPLPESPRVPEGSLAGTAGDAGVYSFYVTKTMTTGEGGMVAVKNAEKAKRMSVMRSHGIDRSVWNRYTDTKASWYYEVIAPGFKYNMPDLLAALGRVQLGRARRLLAARLAIAGRYDTAFSGDEHFTVPPSGPGDARHLYPIRINPKTLSINRAEFIEKLQEQGIGVSVHFIPLHTMPYYKNRYGLRDEDFPETLASFQREISLPIWPGMTDAMIEKVISVVKTLGMKYNK